MRQRSTPVLIALLFLLFATPLFAQQGGLTREDFAPFKANKEEFMQRRFEGVALKRGVEPGKPFDPTIRLMAIQQMQAQKAAMQAQRSGTGISPSGNIVFNNSWTEIGPNPIPNGQVQSGPQLSVSGRTISIAIHPTNPDIVYVGTAQGGLYRTTNGGTTWVPLMDNEASLAIGTIAISPSSPETIYVGTGEANFSADSYFGVGVYRIDNASSASPTITGPLNDDPTNADIFTGRAIGKILVHPTNPAIIFVASTSGIGGIGGVANNTLPSRGIYRCVDATSADPTFTKLTGLEAGGDFSIRDMILDPLNPDLLVCNLVANGGGIYVSTNALSGSPTFVRNLTFTGGTSDVVAEFAIHHTAGPNPTIYAATGFGGGRVYRNTDGGTVWTQQIDNNFCTAQCFYDIAVAVDPTDATRVYLGGSPTLVFGFSTNSAASFTPSLSGLHVDSHVIGVAPSSPSTIYFGSDGGIYKSINSGTTWSSLNNSTFRATQFMGLAVHPTDPNFTIGGTQDNGTNMYKPDATWNRVDFGDGGYAVIDQNAADVTNVTMYHTYFNQTNAMGYGKVTTVAGAADGLWSFHGCGFGGSIPNGMTCAASACLFYAPMENGPGNPNTLYFGSDVLYRSANAGLLMTKVSQEPIQAGVPISAIGISPQNDNVRLVGLSNGALWGTTSGSSVLTSMDPLGNVPNNYIARAVIDPTNVNTAYVTLSAFGVVNIWKTTNLNAASPTWTSISTGIPLIPVNGFVVDPLNTNNLYAGTDIGVYASDNGGTSWIPLGTGLPAVAVFDMALAPGNKLRIATHGRGMWDYSLALAGPIPLIISEVRLRGGNPNGAENEFIEIYNTSDLPYTVASLSGTGLGIAASDGVTRFSIPNGTVIPPHGHYLGVNSTGYSLSGYPAGSGTTATADATYTLNIPDNAGIALFDNNVGGASYILANRLDAVGSTSEANVLYKEGTGYPALTPFNIDYAFWRNTRSGPPQDTDNNATDFEFGDTNGTSAGAGQRLGAPGPQNLSSPLARGTGITVTRLDQTVGPLVPPNMVRDFTSDPANNSTFGTIDLRYRVTNNTGVPLTRLRFRIDSVETFPAPSGIADLRIRTSTLVVVAGINDAVTCAATGIPVTAPCTVNVQGTTLEQPPSQLNGGGFNSSASAGTVTLGTPLANGASINIRLLFGIQQTGNFVVRFTPEILPASAVTGSVPTPEELIGATDGCADVNPVADQYYCAGTTTSAINFTTTFPGTTFNWTNSNTAIGLGASGSGNIPPFTATNSTAAPISGTITVTPVNGACTGTPITFTITVASTPSITGVTNDNVCAPGGVVNLAAAGNGTINWWNASTGGVVVNTGTTYNPNVTATTTYYVDATTTSGPQTLLAMPPQSNTFPGNVRGYWFTAPADFVITSLSVPTTASSAGQSIAVVKFNGNTPPPVFSATTNAFTTEFITRNNAVAGSIPCNIPVLAGEVIGILGYRGNINSYAPGDHNTTIAGFPVQLQRLGMQFPLTTDNPHDLWREFGPTTSISRIEFEYSAGPNCVSAPRVPVTATVDAAPVATATPSSQTICSGSTITTIVLTSTEPGTTYSWTRDNTGTVTGIAASGSGDISGSLTNTTSAPITVTFTITPTVGTCAGAAITATVLVNPAPDAVATPSSQTICTGATITTIVLSSAVSGTTYNWTRDNTGTVTGIAGTGSGDISGALTNTTASPITVTFTITPTANSCPGAATTATVTVNPINTITLTSAAGTDNQTVLINTPITNITYGTTGATGATVTGLPAGVTGNWAANVVTISGTPTVAGLYNYIVTLTGGCGVVTATGTINVIVCSITRTSAAGTDAQTVCINNPITNITYSTTGATGASFSGLPAGVTGNWAAGVATISGTPTASGTFNYTVTPTGGGCSGAVTATGTITVNPAPVAVATPSSQTICSGATITTIVLTSSTPGTTFTWTRDNTVAVTGIAANGSGDISGALTNTTNAPVTVTFTISPTASGCPGPTTTATVVVNPIPNAVATPSSQTRCSGVAIQTIVLSGNVSGTVYNWTRDNTVAVTGIAGSGTGNISGTLTNTTNAPITVTFTITPSYTNAGTTCTGTPITATVLVNPTPNAVATPSSQTICSGSAITPIALTGAVSGTTYTWIRNNTVAVTGMAASGSGTPISGTLTNTTNAPVTVTFTITPTANGCPGPATTATVIVNPIPTVTPPGQMQVIITGNGFFADEITWTLTNAAGTVVLSGGPYGLNPPPTPSALVPSTGGPFSFFIEAQGTFNDNSALWEVRCGGAVVVSGCIRGTASGAVCASVGTLTVPNINGCGTNLGPQTICSGTAITPVVIVGPVAGTVYNWTRDNTANITGIPSSGAGNISGTLTNTTNTIQTTIFTITPSYTNAGVTCTGPPVTVSITVNPTPNAVATPGSQTICSGTAITPVVLTGNVAGTTYAWTRDNTTNITGIPASGSGNISGTLANTTTTLQTTTFTIIPTANGCAGPPTTATVSVQAPLTVVCPANITVNAAAGTCFATVTYAATITGTPAPTVTYVPASGSSFPIGTTTVTVTATNICGTVSCTFTVTVLDVQIPVITPLTNQTVCVGSSATFTAVSTFAVSYQWQSWNGSAWVNIAGATGPSHTINNVTHAMNTNSFRVRVTGPCGTVTTSNHAILYVNTLPTITITSNIQPQLLPGQFITLTATGTPAGGSFVWRKNGIVIAGATGPTLGPLNVLDAGTYMVTYTDPNGCVSSSANFVISAQASEGLYIYPNPNTGQFHVRFYNVANEEATVTVYNYLGAIVYQRKHMTGPLQYSIIDVDLGKRLAIGTYVVDIRNAQNVRIGAKLISVGRE